MDLATLRTDIKSWERDFKAKHGRHPSVQEIKDQPSIAAKYKLYKSLSKAAASGSFSKTTTRSSTPPPLRQPPSSSIVHKSRPVKVDPPLVTSNPFSPVKNRNKFSDPTPSLQRASHQSRPNPFATPSKPKAKPRRSPSPDPFPPIQPLLLAQRPPLPPAADSAVTRARKRLRGEPVSPSPVKQKRPRVASQAALSFTGRGARIHSPALSDGDDPAADPNDTIIADTPMKPRAGARSFKVLFDDALSNGEKRSVKVISSRNKANSPALPRGMKRDRSRALTPSSEEEDDWSTQPKLRALKASAGIPGKHAPMRTRTINGTHGMPKALVPTKSNLWSEIGPTKPSQSKPPPTQSKSVANKRALPDEPDDIADDQSARANGFQNLALLPPSPPPPDPSKPIGSKHPAKGKAKAALSGRKKTKLLRDASGPGSDDESPSDEIQVREIDTRARVPDAVRESDVDSDWDARWRVRPDRVQDGVAAPASPGRFEIDLPDELQRILAISPGGRAREVGEEKVVRELLYGSRETRYGASKGGEIWDVGEDEDEGGAEGVEEDWEGEPVPWEVGEL